MKNKLLSLAVAVLGIPILAHALTFPSPPGVCKNSLLVNAFNTVLTALGYQPICQ